MRGVACDLFAMEAATPLRQPHVTVLFKRLVIDGLVLEDECAVELVSARVEAGEDPAAVVCDALEIGARVLAREQASVNTEFVKTEFEKASREVEQAFTDKARAVAEFFSAKVDEAFGAESGHVTKALERHFSDDSSGAVQHRVKEVVAEVMTRSREDLVRQFSSGDASNPLAGFQRGVLAAMKSSSEQQDANLRRMYERMAELEVQITKLHSEREKQLEVAAEAARGTAKGRTFEESVFEALDRIALAAGDDCEAVGDLKGVTRRTGDVVIGIEAARGPARGRIVFEAKTGRLSRRSACEELDRARAERDAEYAVLVVPSEDKLPARVFPLREINGDKLIVCFDPEEGSTVALEVAYALARARVLMARGGEDEVDAVAIGEAVERALGALEDERRIKAQLTGAVTSIETARSILETLSAAVRAHLRTIEELSSRSTEK